jgi:hypothetical protein
MKRIFASFIIALLCSLPVIAADWNKPALTDTYVNVLGYIDARLDDAALQLDSSQTTPTNLPTGAKRWNTTSSKWEKWTGSAWEDLAATYGIAISGNAVTATNATSHIASATGAEHGATSTNTGNMIVRRDGSGNFSAGTITATLNGNAATATTATNSTQLGGQLASYYLPSASYTASDVLAKILTVDGLNSSLDADSVRGLRIQYGRFAPVATAPPVRSPPYGYTVARTGVGVYQVTLSTGFSDTNAAVFVNSEFNMTVAHVRGHWNSGTTNQFNVYVYNTSHTAYDPDEGNLTFLVLGTR